MIKTVKLAGYEFRRFKGPWPVIGLVFMLLIPTIFAGLYLWSNEDPYGKRDQVPVAVVNLDQPAQTENTTVNAGDRLVRELGSDPIFDWHFVDQDQAEQGLSDGTYYMIVEIPSDFSANLVSGSGAVPERATVNLRLNDATGYLTELLVASAQPRLEAAVNRAALGVYLESVFANLDTIRTAVQGAADSANTIASDTTTALATATDLSTAVSTAKQSSSTVVGNLATAKSSSSALVTSSGDAKASSASAVTALGTATTTASTLSSAASSAASSAGSLASSVGPAISAIDAAAPALGQSATNAQQATQDTSDLVTQELSPQVGQGATWAAQVAARYPDDAQAQQLAALLNNVNNTTMPKLTQSSSNALGAATATNSSAQTVTNAASGLSGAGSDLTSLASNTATVSAGMSTLSDNVSTASSSASTVDSAISGIASQATELDSSIGAAQLAAQTTDDTLTPAETSAANLVTTLSSVNTGATELATGLADTANRVPTLAPGQQADTEQVLSSPANLAVLIDNPAVVYGRGMAPITFGMAIWVFAIAVFLLLRPIASGALLARASSLRITFAGWLPPLLVGVVGAMVLFGVAWLGLHLDPVNAAAAVGVIALGVACFTAITYLLRVWLGAAGTAIAFVLLMVQFTASGGLYPMPTTPAPFQVIEKGLPMTYLVDALRITFTGGVYERLWVDVGALAGFLVVALALSVLGVHRRRTLRLFDLQPMGA